MSQTHISGSAQTTVGVLPEEAVLPTYSNQNIFVCENNECNCGTMIVEGTFRCDIPPPTKITH